MTAKRRFGYITIYMNCSFSNSFTTILILENTSSPSSPTSVTPYVTRSYGVTPRQYLPRDAASPPVTRLCNSLCYKELRGDTASIPIPGMTRRHFILFSATLGTERSCGGNTYLVVRHSPLLPSSPFAASGCPSFGGNLNLARRPNLLGGFLGGVI